MRQAKSVSVAIVVLLASSFSVAHAQDASPASQPAPSEVRWLSDYHFHLSADSIRSDDSRFNWDGRFGGDVDLVDSRHGRLNFVADYSVVIGSEIRPIDPNQSAYHLGFLVGFRWGTSEISANYDHISRHLSDRANRTAVAWNDAGITASAHRHAGRVRATVTGYAAKVVQASFVDYTWQFDARVDASYAAAPRVSLIGRANIAPTLVDPSIAGRGTQTAGRIEAAVRLRGTAASLELFAAWEKRLDPSPLERGTRGWGLLGFRLIGANNPE